MEIDLEALERSGAAVYEVMRIGGQPDWADLDDRLRDYAREVALAAIQAYHAEKS